MGPNESGLFLLCHLTHVSARHILRRFKSSLQQVEYSLKAMSSILLLHPRALDEPSTRTNTPLFYRHKMFSDVSIIYCSIKKNCNLHWFKTLFNLSIQALALHLSGLQLFNTPVIYSPLCLQALKWNKIDLR